ncbi:MAG: ribosome maturation factor RimP [Gammaproteobacteria bacterium]|nr:ribosome maturation factor RimP [Gammaproteobacteria bacterium]
MSKESRLENLLNAEIEGLGYEFIGHVLMQQGGGKLLRVYFDKEGGINVDDCAKVTRHISALLDVDDLITGSYTLEISSPGIERPLFKAKHYQQAVGKRIKLRLHALRNEQRNFLGLLQEANDDTIHLLLDGGELIALRYDEIDKAHIYFI